MKTSINSARRSYFFEQDKLLTWRNFALKNYVIAELWYKNTWKVFQFGFLILNLKKWQIQFIIFHKINTISLIFLGWLYRKKYRSTKSATLTLQRWIRGFLARRKVRHMRKTKAAITLQRYVRGWVKRTQFLQNKDRTVRLQARVRGLQARLRYRELVRNAKALVIQTNIRGYLARKKYRKALRDVVLVQCQIRKFLAKKKLKKLKIQAKSMDHQKKLNKGLENKVILLQQKLSESQKVSQSMP